MSIDIAKFPSPITNESSPARKDPNMLSPEELGIHIEGCVLNDRLSQKRIYNSFYVYSMTICDRYTTSHNDSLEVLNDGFLKIFKEIYRYKPAYADVVASFKGWLRKIMVYTAIDHFRKNKKYKAIKSLDDGIIQISTGEENVFAKMNLEEVMGSLRQLTPAYRTILNLFIVEGFTHEEISKVLGISIGASKSGLARGRMQLKKILFQRDQIQITQNIELNDCMN